VRLQNLRGYFYDKNEAMSKKKKKKDERPVFDSIRKPVAPPSKKMGEAKPSEKVYPAKRKIKHKGKVDEL
jgi:hypothetical protein